MTHHGDPHAQRAHSEQALNAARAVLLTAETGPHSPETASCGPCKAWWQALNETTLSHGAAAVQVVQDLAATIPESGHPLASCADCDGCRVELSLAMTAIALGAVGVDETMAWGPWHNNKTTHEPDVWETCPSCVEWVEARHEARQRLTDAGMDADRWLGTDDEPTL